jgi:hypothetical protein
MDMPVPCTLIDTGGAAMHMLTLFLLALMPIGADVPATPASQRARTWTHDELARELGRSLHAKPPGSLIIGVKAVPLMLEWLPKDAWQPREWLGGGLGTVTTSGVNDLFDPSSGSDSAATRPGRRAPQVSFRIAVYPDRDAAVFGLGTDVQMISSPSLPPTDSIGDIAYVWPGPRDEKTNLLFRRDNVVVSLSLPLPKQQAMEFAARLDGSLSAPGPNVRKGARVEVPRLILPASIRVALQERRHVKLELGDEDAAELLIGTDDPHMIVMRSQEGKPELVYHAPRVAAEAGTKTVTVTVATPMNVVASRRIAVEVTAGP